MLCVTCNDDIFEGDNLNCSKCNATQHFGCAALRESAFRKMSKTAKQNWYCGKCKSNETCFNPLASKTASISKHTDTNIVNNETIKNLVETVNFMSEKFDNFGKQLQELVTTINSIKAENSFLKEENCKLKNEFALLDKRMNVFEQKAIKKFVEIVGVPEVNNEDCVKTVESIAAAVGANISVSKAFRVHSKFTNRSRKIVAELLSTQNKKTMMENVKKSKLTGKVVNSNWNDENIYINDSLTQFNKNLLFKTRAFSRDKGSVNSNFDELTLFLENDPNSDKIDVIILTETWHNPLNQNAFTIEGYKLFFSTIKRNQNDGIFVFVRYNYNVDFFESPSADINVFNNTVNKVITENKKKDYYTVLIRDMNINIVGDNACNNDYLNLLSENGFASFINLYTRLPNGQKHAYDIKTIIYNKQKYDNNDPKEVSNIFNTFFINMGKKLAESSNYSTKNYALNGVNEATFDSLFSKKITNIDVTNILPCHYRSVSEKTQTDDRR
ncbi:hypothetical protein QTP88_017868 [Uroleucon formosanum]